MVQSIHADVAYTLGEYLIKKLRPKSASSHMNIADLEVTKGLVAKKNTTEPQLIQVSASINDVESGVANLEWRSVSMDGVADEHTFATAQIYYDEATNWTSSWMPMTHLVLGRIEELKHLAELGIANRMSRNMAYLLFARNLVDYADKYRGMQSVVLHGLEAFAEVTLTAEEGGVWTVPPYFIDSVAHLAGFIMNVSDANDTAGNFCVTPGWLSMRFARPLVAGASYRSYVKMIPTKEDTSVFLGDIYVLEADQIIGVVGAIKFRRYPRILLGTFFSAPDQSDHDSATMAPKPAAAPLLPRAASKPQAAPRATAHAIIHASHRTAAEIPILAAPTKSQVVETDRPTSTTKDKASADIVVVDSDSTASKALAMVAEEVGVDISDLQDDVNFTNLGVDSLMSLVISAKLRQQFEVNTSGSLFLEYPTVGDLRAWLLEYYS